MTVLENHQLRLSLNSGHLGQLSFIFGENWLLFFARDVNMMLRKNIATFPTWNLLLLKSTK